MNTPALIFDIDDTLYDQYTPLADACEEALGGRTLPDKNRFFECFSRRSREMFLVSERGEVSIHQSRIYRISNTMKDLGIPFTDEQAETFQQLYTEKQRRLALTAPIREMLDFCKSAGIPMGCLTNGPEGHQTRKFRTLGLGNWIPEEYLLVSGGVGCAKPDVRIFRMTEERMGLVPENAYMVGDSCENDMAGAFAAGWKTIWVNRHGKTWPAEGISLDRNSCGSFQKPDHGPKGRPEKTAFTAYKNPRMPDFTVHDDPELASLVRALAAGTFPTS